ncbi:plasmid pRiA4b ORF-3 family protein [Manganibacter manganicus]|uniref:plasmid pRiA4b ORF-3 family protein n=1 Tax=Manganibacter manganicus TaxID=1873176 RepID=UPI001FD89EF5|nr:plasmid pRiA4b ORF-3 family protein [Pseudaminobacter manganicus]
MKPPRRSSRRSEGAQTPDTTPTVLQFRIWLKGLSPMVWRRVQVPATMTLREFHGVLQVAMGWEGIHLYQFVVHTVRYGSWELTAEPPDIGLDALKLRTGSRFLYEYDLNVPWEHEVRLEHQCAAKPQIHYPCCIGGAGTCPPEDSDGPEAWILQEDEALGLGLDEDLASALEFFADISETRSFAILDDPDRAEEFRELLLRIDRRNALLGRTFERQTVNKRLRQEEHLTLMHQQI